MDNTGGRGGAIRFADSWVLGGWFSWGSARTSFHPRLMATAPPVLDLRGGLRRVRWTAVGCPGREARPDQSAAQGCWLDESCANIADIPNVFKAFRLEKIVF